jgi:hypothetical protein
VRRLRDSCICERQGTVSGKHRRPGGAGRSHPDSTPGRPTPGLWTCHRAAAGDPARGQPPGIPDLGGFIHFSGDANSVGPRRATESLARLSTNFRPWLRAPAPPGRWHARTPPRRRESSPGFHGADKPLREVTPGDTDRYKRPHVRRRRRTGRVQRPKCGAPRARGK